MMIAELYHTSSNFTITPSSSAGRYNLPVDFSFLARSEWWGKESIMENHSHQNREKMIKIEKEMKI